MERPMLAVQNFFDQGMPDGACPWQPTAHNHASYLLPTLCKCTNLNITV